MQSKSILRIGEYSLVQILLSVPDECNTRYKSCLIINMSSQPRKRAIENEIPDIMERTYCSLVNFACQYEYLNLIIYLVS